MASTIARFTLTFYAPPASVAACKTAVFAAGAGRYPGSGGYTECCWSALGTGQFRPGEGANPYIGSRGVAEETPEVRVETLCLGRDTARKAVDALKKCVTFVSVLLHRNTPPPTRTDAQAHKRVHPYEEPVYFVTKIEDEF
ncbi:ngg1p interacting factor 3 protein, nif3 [Geosmithia morbida]|uniref:ATP phosphoribosyltransferase n=1 Tax=Geosmithia morbida TaxID=1094350 RepID=A0A9P4YWU3_9HYPO|nr:ngg1p interacting factor 3 protein, nif3 [Geosmithia morbida]KAF4124538.1 ngg1p interacting factor 3 protein, nif3 [Geosmithia morbida]